MGNKTKGYILGSLAAATYGLNPLFALPLYSDGMGVDSVLFFRYVIAIPLIALMMLIRGRSFKIKPLQVFGLGGLGLLVALSSLALFLSYTYMAAGIASTLLFVYPIMVAVMMVCFFKEKISPVTVLCTATAIAGIGLLFKNSDGDTISVVGTIWVMISALSYAIYIVAINKSSLAKVPTLTATFYILLFGVLLFAARLLSKGNIDVPSAQNGFLWLALLGLAVFPTVVSFVCTTSAIHNIGSTKTAILGALEPVTAVLIGICVFGEELTPRSLIGLIMIIGAVTVVVSGPKMGERISYIKKMFPRVRKNK
ncbi:MAG: EamA family transporter [Paramuribaculum sp.]|nr:EamA family transporter [Paramuribaculum sp.]